jgi:hypothetical protein
VPEVSGSRPTGSAATIDRRGVMLGTLILAPLKLVGACVWCPCVVVPGENLADPARLVPRARQEATAIFTGLVVRIDTVETRSSPDQSTASPRTDAPASFLGCAYQKPSCERSDRGLILEGSNGPGGATFRAVAALPERAAERSSVRAGMWPAAEARVVRRAP